MRQAPGSCMEGLRLQDRTPSTHVLLGQTKAREAQQQIRGDPRSNACEARWYPFSTESQRTLVTGKSLSLSLGWCVNWAASGPGVRLIQILSLGVKKWIPNHGPAQRSRKFSNVGEVLSLVVAGSAVN